MRIMVLLEEKKKKHSEVNASILLFTFIVQERHIYICLDLDFNTIC